MIIYNVAKLSKCTNCNRNQQAKFEINRTFPLRIMQPLPFLHEILSFVSLSAIPHVSCIFLKSSSKVFLRIIFCLLHNIELYFHYLVPHSRSWGGCGGGDGDTGSDIFNLSCLNDQAGISTIFKKCLFKHKGTVCN